MTQPVHAPPGPKAAPVGKAAWVLAIALASPWSGAWADLGGKPISTGGTAAAVLHSLQTVTVSAKSSSSTSYSVQVVTLETGTSVTEYMNSAGVVFAVQWSGRVLPDYAQVLGTQVQTFRSALQTSGQAGRRSGAVGVSQNGLVVSSSGHMGSYQGYAYLTSLVPDGVDVLALLA